MRSVYVHERVAIPAAMAVAVSRAVEPHATRVPSVRVQLLQTVRSAPGGPLDQQ
jgi:hypothetical protein